MNLGNLPLNLAVSKRFHLLERTSNPANSGFEPQVSHQTNCHVPQKKHCFSMCFPTFLSQTATFSLRLPGGSMGFNGRAGHLSQVGCLRQGLAPWHSRNGEENPQETAKS